MKQDEFYIENSSKPFHVETRLDAKDLRVGNWVQTTIGHYEQVENIHEEGINIFVETDYGVSRIEAELSFGVIRPIPLTPEILEKCGFEDYEYNGHHGYQCRWSKDSIYGFLNPSNMFCLLDYDRRHLNIQYLHQLQNLFHALTGEELTINL
jgi:hypothetical protein